jgi:3-oxoacid CoA-transferase subunit A
MNKVVKGPGNLMHLFRDGLTIMSGGFGLCGNPEKMIDAVAASGYSGLTVISNNIGIDDVGLGKWLANGQIKKILASYVGENKTFERLLLDEKIDLEFVPQGTLAERIRAGGAGIPAFFVPAGVGTEVQGDKEVREFDGKAYLMERGLRADIAIVKAWKGDPYGNLVFRHTANNFNQAMAEVEELVPVGALDPDFIHVPGIFVQYIFEGKNYEKRIERLTVRE